MITSVPPTLLAIEIDGLPSSVADPGFEPGDAEGRNPGSNAQRRRGAGRRAG